MSVNTKAPVSQRLKLNLQAGFTMTELIIAVTSGSLVALTVLSISLFFFGDLMRANAETQLVVESQNILTRTVEDIRTSTRILTSTTITDPNETGGWSTSDADNIIIISTPAVNASNEFIFDADSGEPYQDEIIYFKRDETLFKRVLANAAATGNIAKTTCPAELATSSCPADPTLSTNFDNMSFNFYDQDSNATTVATDARSIEITLTMIDQVFGQTARAQNNIRMTLRNPT